jgi:hypothetical protein
VLLLPLRSLQAQAAVALAFRAGDQGTFTFDTGQLRGKLRTADLAFGLHDVHHVRSGTKLTGRFGVAGVYRVFSDGTRYGDAGWHWPSSAELLDNGAVVIQCPATADRPFRLAATYTWREPTTVDVEIQVLANRDLHGFEVFLASYFDPQFSLCRANVRSLPGTRGKAGYMSAAKSLGDWLMFPRDAEAVELIQDGRWDLPPHPVRWTIQPKLERPLVVRRQVEGNLAALLMARPEDCFAVAMPYETEGHFSVYLSLFGYDVAAGQTAVARARLQVLTSPAESDLIQSFSAFLEQTGGK